MIVATGKSILNGIAIGKIKIYKAPVYEINTGLIEDVDAEVARFNAAVAKAIDQQGVLYEKAKKRRRRRERSDLRGTPADAGRR